MKSNNKWKSETEKPKVSILCAAFNHEDYISDALDSFVMQETDFPYEVIVHDDASTDNTTRIIKNYQKKYPDVIKPIFQEENQYSKGINVREEYMQPKAQGEYIAICEGDDYWTDTQKLQKQYDFLQNHPKIDICTHKAEIIHFKGEHVGFQGPDYQTGIIPTGKVILGGGAFVATNSIMIRKKMLVEKPSFMKILSYDYTMQINGSLRGGMGYINECMSVYRFMVPGSWSTTFRRDNAKYLKHKALVEIMFRELDICTDGKFRKEIDIMVRRSRFDVLMIKEDYRTMLRREYRDILKEMSWKTKIKIVTKSIFQNR